MGTGIQQFELVLGTAIGLAALGTLLLALVGRWIGGSWTTQLAILLAMLLAYRPLVGASLFSDFRTDILRRILLSAIPFTLIAIGLSYKRVPFWVRAIYTIAGPILMFWFVFANYPQPGQTFVHRVLPVSGVILVTWLLIEPIAHRSPGVAAPMIIGCFCGTAAFALIDSVEQQAGFMAPIIPATAAGAVVAGIVAAILKMKISFARGPVLLWLTLMGALYTFLWVDSGDLPGTTLCWIAAIPLLAWVVEIPYLHRLRPWKRELIRLALMAIPAVVPSVMIYRDIQQQQM